MWQMKYAFAVPKNLSGSWFMAVQFHAISSPDIRSPWFGVSIDLFLTIFYF